MRLWRVCKRRYPPFTGDGGLFVSGRWHLRGARIVYTVGSKALGVLEFLAHLPARELPVDSAWWWLELDAGVPIETVEPESLPRGWDAPKCLKTTQALGTQWILSNRTPVLRVPSVHVSGEWNFLINPAHPLAAPLLATVGGPEPFVVDRRLLKAEWAQAARSVSASRSEDETEEMFMRALRSLSPALRETFTLHAQGKSLSEIATLLRIPAGTVARRLHEARKRVMEQL